MRKLYDVLQRFRPHFEEGGRLQSLKPVYDATENFFFAPLAVTVETPHLRDALDLKRFMAVVVVGLLPCLAAALHFFGLRVLAMIFVSYAVGGTIEVLFAIVRKEEINEGFLVTGLIFPLTLPPSLPLWIVAVGIAIGVVLGKELFGGTGRNPFNPALVGRCFLAIGYPAAMAGNWLKPGSGTLGRLAQYVDSSSIDAISSATPLSAAKQGVFAGLPDLFWGNVAGSAGETSAIAILIGGIILVVTRVASWRTVAGVLLSFALLNAVLHHVDPGTFAPVLWNLCAGGLLFGAFFMATDPVTSPFTNGGKWAYGIIIGAVTLLIRSLTGYVEGVMFAILLGNIAAPLLDEAAVRIRLRRLSDEI